jgi:hypothetical protein
MLDVEQDLSRVLRTVVNTPRKKAAILVDSGPGSTSDNLGVLGFLEMMGVDVMALS